MKILHPGADSLENAKCAEDYPYGRLLRTKMYFFVEHRKGFGSRAVTQSLNPKTGKMNKPHAGTYSPLPIYVGENTENGYFDFIHVPRYPDTYLDGGTKNLAQEFINEFWSQVPSEDKKFIKVFWDMVITLSPEHYKDFIIVYPD